jgi:NTE family protein
MRHTQRSLTLLFLSLFLFNVGCAHNPQHQPTYNLPAHPPTASHLENVKVALVLSGGGARALAHAGVLEVLEQHQIPVDLIVGSSGGSLIGAIYADNPHSKTLKQKVIKLNKWDILDISWYSGFKMLWRLTGPVKGDALKRYLQTHLRSKNFNDLRIPMAVVTTDADTGETYVIRSGPIIPALHASSAIPMVFSPVHIYGRTLIDGGVSSPMPVEIAKEFSPKVIIAVDIGTSPDYGRVNNTYQLASRSLHISYFHLVKWQAKQADIVIHPNIDEYGMFDDHANEEMYEAGRQAAIKALPEIQKALKAS